MFAQTVMAHKDTPTPEMHSAEGLWTLQPLECVGGVCCFPKVINENSQHLCQCLVNTVFIKVPPHGASLRFSPSVCPSAQCSRRPRNLRLRIFSWSSSSMRTMPSSPSILSRIPVASRSSPRITFTFEDQDNEHNF